MYVDNGWDVFCDKITFSRAVLEKRIGMVF